MTCLCYDALPSSTFFCKAFAEWYTIESIMPATVNTPPIIAQIPVKKCANDLEKSNKLFRISDSSFTFCVQSVVLIEVRGHRV